MDSSIVLCGHDLLWCTALKKEFENENIFICHADGIEDIENIFSYINTDIIVCSIEEFYNFTETLPAGGLRRYITTNKTSILVIADFYSANDEMAVLTQGCFDYQLRNAPIQAIAQRIRNRLADKPHNKNIYYDNITKDIYSDGCLVKLTKREKDVLYILLSNKGIPVEKNVILHEIWGNGFTGSSRVIVTVVKQLRKKLSGSNIQIITHYGRGISAVIQ